MVIQSLWKNLGQTPTRDLEIYFDGRVLDASEPCTGMAIDEAELETHRYQLGPGQDVRSSGYVVKEADLDSIYKGEKKLFVAGLAKYKDTLSDEPRQTRFSYRVHLFRDRSKPLEGDNFSWVEWYITGPHNCADDECEDS